MPPAAEYAVFKPFTADLSFRLLAASNKDRLLIPPYIPDPANPPKPVGRQGALFSERQGNGRFLGDNGISFTYKATTSR